VESIDEYLTLLGLPTGGAVRVSLGLVSTIGDVERFLDFVRSTYTDRVMGSDGLAPRTRC
jgi:selenocysteine lyase/cysteine desulfurase